MQGLIKNVFSFVYWKFCFDFILLEGGVFVLFLVFLVGGGGRLRVVD